LGSLGLQTYLPETTAVSVYDYNQSGVAAESENNNLDFHSANRDSARTSSPNKREPVSQTGGARPPGASDLALSR
jgi:hypothetical protein